MFQFLRGTKKSTYITSILISGIDSAAYELIPLLISFNYLTKLDYNIILKFSIIFFGLTILQMLTSILYNKHINLSSVKWRYTINENVMENLFNASPSIIAKYGTGYINNTIEKLSSSITNLLRFIFIRATDITFSLIVFLFAGFKQSFINGIILAISFIVAIILFYWIQKKQQPYIESNNYANAEYSKYFIDYVLNIKTIKLLNVFNYTSNKLKAERKKVEDTVIQRSKIEAIKWFSIRVIVFIPVLTGILLALKDIYAGIDRLGLIVFYVYIIGEMRYNVTQIGTILQEFQEYKVYKKNYNECILEMKTNKETIIFKEITYTDIEFKYEDSNFIVKVPSLVIEKNDKICITGESGQGKTTLLNIITGVLHPQEGEIILNGNLKDVSVAYAYVSQETELFNTTIRENLCLGKDVKEEEILYLLKEVGLQGWYNHLEQGLETLVGEKGLKLSTGQKQRLNLVRAILLNREIYILNEPTSNLDEHTEKLIIEVIKKYLSDKTIIIVTHRPNLLELCSKFYKFENHELKKV